MVILNTEQLQEDWGGEVRHAGQGRVYPLARNSHYRCLKGLSPVV